MVHFWIVTTVSLIQSSSEQCGWVTSVRKQKTILFINVNDGSCKDSIQVVVSRSNFQSNITPGSSVSISGTLNKDPRGNIELSAESIDILGQGFFADGYPFTHGQKHSLEYCRQYLHHRPKLTFFSCLLRIRQAATLSVHKYFTINNFVGVHTPILTSNDCEGAGETFLVKPSNNTFLKELEREGKHSDEFFFNTRAYLTVSSQFHLEVIARSITKTYTFNPTFRSENSKSRVHLSEFYMVEAEQAFISSLKDILITMETFVKSLILDLLQCEKDVNYILENNETNCNDHLQLLGNILDKPFTVMSYSEAKEITEKYKDSINHYKSELKSFSKEEELFLVKHNGNVPIFVIDWPKTLKPFYVKEINNTDKVQAVDLLVPVVGELCGGSVREDDFDKLNCKLEEMGLVKQLSWYLELRKFGNTPTGGFGMGFERFLQFALNINNIKDTIPFPRWPHNLQL